MSVGIFQLYSHTVSHTTSQRERESETESETERARVQRAELAETRERDGT